MKLPRGLSGRQLAKALRILEYVVTRQSGSHMRLTTERKGGHHITIPDHPVLRTGTVSGLLREIAQRHGLTRDELIELLFEK